MKILKIVQFIVLSSLVLNLSSGQFKSNINKRPVALIKNPPSQLKIIAPNGNEKITIGSKFQIKWETSGFRANINIILKNNKRQIGTIARNLNASTHLYLWEVGKQLGNRIIPGSSYTIEIKDAVGQSVDISDKPFTILARTLQFNPSNNQSNIMVSNAQDMVTNNNKPDFIIDRVKILPDPVYYGDNYQIKIWLKKYPPLSKTAKVHMKNINVDAPFLLIFENSSNTIPRNWNPGTPQLIYNIPNGDRIYERNAIDISKQQRKKVILNFDPNNQIDEKNETNNTQSHRFRILLKAQKLPDLIFYRHTYIHNDSTSFEKGVNEAVNCWVEIYNDGNASAGNFTMQIIGDDNRDKGTKFTRLIRIRRSLAPKEKYRINFRLKWTTPGMKVCNSFILDINNEIQESNEDNNKSTRGMTARIK